MKKSKKLVALILRATMLIGTAFPVSAASPTNPYTTVCPSCHTNSGVRGQACKCRYFKANANSYKCTRCSYGYYYCVYGHCYE